VTDWPRPLTWVKVDWEAIRIFDATGRSIGCGSGKWAYEVICGRMTIEEYVKLYGFHEEKQTNLSN
jgi:hypothetical protein